MFFSYKRAATTSNWHWQLSKLNKGTVTPQRAEFAVNGFSSGGRQAAIHLHNKQLKDKLFY